MITKALDRLRDIRRQRIWSPDLANGRRGEDLAHRYLRSQGFVVIARNYRLPGGGAEADIIAREGQELVIVEVKSRLADEFGPAERAIGEEKRHQLLRVARAYARKTETPWNMVRIDAVGVILASPPQITHHRGALRTSAH